MNLIISRTLSGYLSEPSKNDGIIILHIDPKDADTLESVFKDYGFKTKRNQITDGYIEKNNANSEPVAEEVAENAAKKKKTTSKSSRKLG